MQSKVFTEVYGKQSNMDKVEKASKENNLKVEAVLPPVLMGFSTK